MTRAVLGRVNGACECEWRLRASKCGPGHAMALQEQMVEAQP